MKHLMTLVALLVSTAAVAQIPTLPWNPDENGDQFIGLPDLLGLLTVYGQEFQNAIVSEDGESAIMYLGVMGYPQCSASCRALPGFWQIAELEDLGPIIPTWNVSNDGGSHTWLKTEIPKILNGSDIGVAPTFYYINESEGEVKFRANLLVGYRCYCTAKQLPRVEYSTCEGSNGIFIPCFNEKVAEGWYPLGGISLDQIGSSLQKQAFWRFAQ